MIDAVDHVVLGAGAVGLAIAETLARRGESVRVVNPLTEDRAHDAHTRKGRVRARMPRDLMAADAGGTVQVTVGRASDFSGPRGGAQC